MTTLKKHRYKLFLILAFLWMVIIFVNSSLGGDASSGLSEFIVKTLVKMATVFGESPVILKLIDTLQSDGFHVFIRKLAHLIEFGILGLFLTAGLGVFKSLRSRFNKRCMVASAAAILYAVTDEVHQLFVPGRVGAVTDVLIDSAGVVTFVAIMILLIEKGKKNGKEETG